VGKRGREGKRVRWEREGGREDERDKRPRSIIFKRCTSVAHPIHSGSTWFEMLVALLGCHDTQLDDVWLNAPLQNNTSSRAKL